MPTVKRPAALAKIYAAAKRKIDADGIPTLLLQQGQTLYRSINPTSAYTPLPKPAPGGHVSKMQANKLLAPADGAKELSNRFSGPSYDPNIPSTGGLYCVQQQQALVNESKHYSGKAAAWALSGRCVLRIVTMGTIHVADLSPHNSRALRFLRELGGKTWDDMVDPDDCSIARGIGLAIAHTPGLRGLSVQTVRESERSAEERGDNLVLFGAAGAPIPTLYIDEAMFFGKRYEPEIFPVQFP